MLELSDLIKINYIKCQTIDNGASAGLRYLLGIEGQISTYEDLVRLRLGNLELSIIRSLYEQLREKSFQRRVTDHKELRPGGFLTIDLHNGLKRLAKCGYSKTQERKLWRQ